MATQQVGQLRCARPKLESVDSTFDFAEGEAISTEYSYKYTVEELQRLAADAGFTPSRVWTDERQLFSVHYLVAT